MQLTSLGHVASIDLIVRGQSELHRVRTGPYDSREAADRARNQIEQTVAGGWIRWSLGGSDHPNFLPQPTRSRLCGPGWIIRQPQQCASSA